MAIDADLTQALPHLPRKLGAAARYALDNPNRIALESMRASAQACDVAPPTMLRLARHLGYPRYDDFRKAFQTLVIGQGFRGRVEALRSNFQAVPQIELIEGLASAAQRNIAEMAAYLDPAVIQTFVASVRRGGRTHVIGAGSMYWIAGMMEATGRLALANIVPLPGGSVALAERISTIGEQDTLLALGVAPYAVQTIDAMRCAGRAGAMVYAITDKASSPLAPLAHGVFLAPTASPHYYPSAVSLQLVVEILLAACAAASTSAASMRLKAVDELRQASGAYLED